MALTGNGVQVGSASQFGVGLGSPTAMASNGTTVYLFHPRRAYTLDVTNGRATQIGANNLGLGSNPRFSAAMFHSNLIHVHGTTSDQVYTLDTVTNTVTAIGAALSIAGSASSPVVTGMTSLNGTVYAAEAFTDSLMTLDITSGVLTPVDGNTVGYGLTSPNLQSLATYKGMLVAVNIDSTDADIRLVQLSTVDGTATAFNTVTPPDDAIVGMTEHDGQLLAVGNDEDALFRMYDVLWDETIADFEVEEGDDATFDLAAISQDASLFSLQGTPPGWLSITGAATDLVATTAPDVTADTNFDVVVRATRSGITVDETLRIVVTDAGGMPAALSFGSGTIADQSWDTGDTVSLTLPEATGGTGTITYTLSPTLPAGLTFDATARTITGTTTAVFTSAEFTYTATDGNADTVTLTFDAVVAASALTFSTTIADQSLDIGDTVNLTLPAATGVGTITYTLSPTLPSGLAFNATARTITGTTDGAFASAEFTYTATDPNGTTATLTFEMAVAAAALTFSQTIADQSLSIGDIVNLTLPEASGGTGTITYTLTPTVPAGLAFNATARTLTGTTAAVFTSAEFTYTATDGDGDTVTLTFDMVVTEPLPIAIDGTIGIQNLTVGTEIDIQLPTASGGMGALTYELTPDLPDDVTFDEDTQRLSGTPRVSVRGVEYRYRVEDTAGTTITLYFRLYVRPTAYTAGNQELVSMLPPNSTEWERAVEETLRENILPVDDNDHVKMPTIDAWNPDLIPAALTPYLGLNLSIEVDAALPETEQRNLLRASYGIHSIEGTPQALLDVIHALGYAGAVINEGVEDPADNTTHWAHYSIFINQSITIVDAQRMVDLVKDLAPARCKLVSVDIASGTDLYDGTLTYDGTHTYGQIDTVTGLVL